jgi:hypothetical protein
MLDANIEIERQESESGFLVVPSIWFSQRVLSDTVDDRMSIRLC